MNEAIVSTFECSGWAITVLSVPARTRNILDPSGYEFIVRMRKLSNGELHTSQRGFTNVMQAAGYGEMYALYH